MRRQQHPLQCARGSTLLLLAALVGLGGLFPLLAASFSVASDAEEERLAMIGIKLFRATLAADLAVEQKTDAQGQLVLVLFYTNDRGKVEYYGDRLLQGGAIRKLSLRIELSNDPDLTRFQSQSIAGVFVAQPPVGSEVLVRLQSFGIRHHTLVYSPFAGHVEQGIASGQFIAARVQPYINMQSLKLSGIELKPFFIRVAKQYK